MTAARIPVFRPNARRPHVYSVRLSDDEIRVLNQMVRDSERTISEIIRDAIGEYVERYA